MTAGYFPVPYAGASARFIVPTASTSNERFTPRPKVHSSFLFGDVTPGWRITQLLWVNLERDDDGSYIMSDTLSVVYGVGDTPFKAEQDYIVSLIEYYQLLAARASDPHAHSQFRRLRRYLHPVEK